MRKSLWVVPFAAMAVLVLTVLSFLPATATADTRYAAGNLTSGTNICNCPVTVGNCVCAYTDPEPAPKEPELVGGAN
jgi:hypothetical protein